MKCICALFETRGILCRRVISVLLSKIYTILPQKYYLSRWRKDIKQRYTLVKSIYDVDPNEKRYDIMCMNFATKIISCDMPSKMEVLENVDIFLLENLSEFKEEVVSCQLFKVCSNVILRSRYFC
jgi:hypothetical protein